MGNDNDDTTPRTIAGWWHGGQGSALYAYTSSGYVGTDLAREIAECQAMVEANRAQYTDEDARQLARLADHVKGFGPVIVAVTTVQRGNTNTHDVFVSDRPDKRHHVGTIDHEQPRQWVAHGRVYVKRFAAADDVARSAIDQGGTPYYWDDFVQGRARLLHEDRTT